MFITQGYDCDLDSCFGEGSETVRYLFTDNRCLSVKIHRCEVQSCLVRARQNFLLCFIGSEKCTNLFLDSF